jgi:hypothetical protein
LLWLAVAKPRRAYVRPMQDRCAGTRWRHQITNPWFEFCVMI